MLRSSCALLVLAVLVLGGCGSSDDASAPSGSSGASDASSSASDGATHDYPAPVKQRFVRSCTASATAAAGADKAAAGTELCTKALECIEQKVTLAEFTVGEQAMIKGKANEEFMGKMQGCITQVSQSKQR